MKYRPPLALVRPLLPSSVRRLVGAPPCPLSPPPSIDPYYTGSMRQTRNPGQRRGVPADEAGSDGPASLLRAGVGGGDGQGTACSWRRASTSAAVEPVPWALVRGGGHCSARGTPAYVPARLETAATAAIHGAVQLQPANGHGCDRWKTNVCTFLLPLCSRQRRNANVPESDP